MKTYKALLPHAEEVLKYLAERYRLYVVPNGFMNRVCSLNGRSGRCRN